MGPVGARSYRPHPACSGRGDSRTKRVLSATAIRLSIHSGFFENPSDDKKQECATDYLCERDPNGQKTGPTNEDHESLARQKSAGQSVANHEGHGDRQYTEIVSQ